MITQNGMVGDFTYEKLNDFLNMQINCPTISTAPPSLIDRSVGRIPATSPNPMLKTTSEIAGWMSFFIDENTPWARSFIDSIPRAWQNMNTYSNRPGFIFRHPHGVDANVYKRINMGETISHYLSVFGYLLQVITVGDLIEEFRRKWGTGCYDTRTHAVVEEGGGILQLILGAPEAMSRFRTLALSRRFLITGAGCSQAGWVAALSRANCYVGAFLLGWGLGRFIGDIKLPNGKTIQYYIDQVINDIWEHPYEKLSFCGPVGISMATGIAAWKKCIELWVNRVKTLKPLTPEQQKKLNEYIETHPDAIIRYS